MILERIRIILEESCLIDPYKPLLLGVSGGPDSLFMLDALHKLGYLLVIAHFDHGLRPSSAAEQEKIRTVAAQYQYPFLAGREDVRNYARRNRQSIEEAARNLRYRFLFSQAESARCQAVAVGHNANDQVETVLMHFLRGSGLSGIRGMDFRILPNPWNNEIPLIRPLLSTWREEILSELAQRKIVAIQDESNQDLKYYRNRLRNELIPYLEKLNPGMQKRTLQTTSILTAEDCLINDIVAAAWGELANQIGDHAIAIETRLFNEKPLAIRRRLMRQAIAELRPGLRNIDFATIEKAIDFMKTPTQSLQIDLASGLRLEQAGDRTWLADWRAAIPVQYYPQMEALSPILLDMGSSVEFSNGWQLTMDIIPAEQALTRFNKHGQDPWRGWLDLEKITFPLRVRCRRPGDRFRPLGMGGHSIKLSDYWINHQLPRPARSHWPLILSDEHIAWIPGFTISESFAVTASSKEALHLKMRHRRHV